MTVQRQNSSTGVVARSRDTGAVPPSAGGADRAAAAAPIAREAAKTPRSRPETVDFCIVGTGVAGRLVALKAAETGASVMLVTPPGASADAGPTLRTALPFAPLALIEAANLRHGTHLVRALGLDVEPGTAAQTRPVTDDRLSGEGLVRHIRLVDDAVTARTSAVRLRALRVSLLTAPVAFEDAKVLRLGDVPGDRAGAQTREPAREPQTERRIAARRFVLAPEPAWDVPAIPGINEIDYLTPDRPLIASRPIEHLTVIGLSDAGLALAQAHQRLGATVTLLPSPTDDPDRLEDEIVRLALMGIAHDGVTVRLDAAISRIEARGREAVVHLGGSAGGQSLPPGQVLLAPRLRTHYADPGWEAAQIALADGAPTVDAGFYTSNRRVQVIGAETGDGFNDIFSWRLERDADFIVDSLRHRRMPAATVPIRVIPTTPEVAIVGLDENRARAAHKRISVTRAPYAHHPARLARQRSLAAPAGELKLIAGNGRIVGCAIAGDGAREIAGLWALAIARGLRLDDVGGLAFPDIARHSLTRRATQLSVLGWPLGGSLLLRLVRLWRKIRG